MTATEVIAALQKRHPDLTGEWITYTECWRMDFFALRCWASGIGHHRVGYEIKVSRADFLSELRKPGKRLNALGLVHEFYFAMPKGIADPDDVPAECGLVHVFESGRSKVIRPAPRRVPRAFTMSEIVYLARFPLYRDGIADMAAELARLRAEDEWRQQRQKRLDEIAEQLDPSLRLL